MIAKSEMLSVLVESCQSFTEKWEKHKQEYQDEEDYLPYIALGELARHLIELENQNRVTEIESVFAIVEKLYIEGDSYVKEAAVIGLLESLQNILKDHAESFVKYLGPESQKWWNELNKFWNGEIRFVGETINE